MESLLPFAAIAALIVLTPGPDMMLVTRSVLGGGRRAGVLTAIGIATGSACWALAAAAGLATLLSASPDLLALIRLLGAGYLGWIGLRALASTASSRGELGGGERASHRSGMEAWRTGLISNLLHPGQVVFYTSMLPQFIDPGSDPTPQVLGLGALFVAVVLIWFTTYALLASSVRAMRWSSLAPLMRRITGVVLIGFAVRLAVRL